MQEYVTRAVVLDKMARGGDADARYFLFTERFGGRSGKKATNGFKQIADGLIMTFQPTFQFGQFVVTRGKTLRC